MAKGDVFSTIDTTTTPIPGRNERFDNVIDYYNSFCVPNRFVAVSEVYDTGMADDEIMELSNDNNDSIDTPSSLPPAKKQKTVKSHKDSSSQSAKPIDLALVEHAKKRLSKWAARLFDPDRPRGLVEPPQTIPLNDEFLSAFGKRERTEKAADLEIDTQIESEDEEENRSGMKQGASADNDKKKTSNSKIKVSNLAYRTTGAALTAACEQFGPLVEVNLILDKERQGGSTILNSGRAYVTFEFAESAQACLDGMKKLDGRELRVSLATQKKSSRSSTSGGSSSLLNRYWDKDISTVCFRCGQVGHIGKS